jgi:hypothetical protein
MGFMDKILEDATLGLYKAKNDTSDNLPAVYEKPKLLSSTQNQMGAGSNEGTEIVRATNTDRLAIRGHQIKADEAFSALRGIEEAASGEFRSLAKDLRHKEDESDTLMKEYNDLALHETANYYHKYKAIAAENIGRILDRSVDRG